MDNTLQDSPKLQLPEQKDRLFVQKALGIYDPLMESEGNPF